MTSDSATEFDVGPLSWVGSEIDQALGRGLDSLASFAAVPSDTAALRHARTHVHQAAGAIQMVGLDPLVAYVEEVERQLAGLETLPPGDVASACATVDRAARKLRAFLAELLNGAPLVALRLFPEYEAMQQRRGVRAPTPTDLFFPDLSPRAPASVAVQTITGSKLAAHLLVQRRRFQQGLLLLLRGDRTGAVSMREAIGGIETVTAQPGMRAFWWTVGALFDAIVAKGLDPEIGVKQLAARIDLQIRRLVDGSTKVADRLRRDVLYFVAISSPVVPSVWEVQRTFKLAVLIPPPAGLSDDVLRVEPLLRQARDQIGAAKDAWVKYTSGRAENLPKLKQTLATVGQVASEIGNPALTRLTASLATRLDAMPAGHVPEAVAMEYATGLLLAENAFANFTSLADEFPKQVEQMVARLDAVQAGRMVDAAAAASLLDEMSKRAQERMLLAQVCREIQVNLRRMEQVLDGFFRDQGKRADLASLAKDSGQIRGALRMLGLDQAERLLGLCAAQIEAFAHPDTTVENDELELLAESLSSLGFYVEAVEQQRPGRERLIAPLLAKRLGEPPSAEVEEAPVSAETAVAQLRAALPALLAEVRQAPADEIARQSLKTKVRALRDDAELIGDAELTAQADAALQEFALGGTTSLTAAVSAITEAATPAPAISEETQRLLATDEQALNAEFLDIYLTEAGEVLDTIAANRALLEHNHGARDALRTVRRGFHTLKGSGRMVGLAELGELAYEVEKIHNRLLEEDHPVTPMVVAMIGVAEESFREWVTELRLTGRVRPDATVLQAAVADVEATMPGAHEVVAEPVRVDAAPPAEVPKAAEVHAAVEAHASAEIHAPAEFAELGAGGASAPQVDEIEAAEEFADVSSEEASAVAPEATFAAPAMEPAEVAPEETAAVAPGVAAEIAYEEIAGFASGEPAEVAPAEAAGFASAEPAGVVSDEPAEVAPEATPAAPPTPEPAPVPEPEEIAIGDVTVSMSLFRIVVDEAEQHLATLGSEVDTLRHDANATPSAQMIRASHTLCGINRTAGFALVAQTALALEQCLLGLQQHGAPLPAVAVPVIGRAIEGLSDLVLRVKSRVAFTGRDQDEAREIQGALDTLRAQTSAGAIAADAEALAARDAASDEGHAPPAEDAAREEDHAPPAEDAAREEDRAPPAEDASRMEDHPQPMQGAARPDDHGQPAQDAEAPTVTAGPAAALVPDSQPAPAMPATPTPSAREEPAVARAAAQPQPEADPLQGVRDDVDAQVLPLFLEEATELFPQAGEALRSWRRRPGSREDAQRLRRTLHTFKGSARMAGAMRLGALTHRMESRLDEGEAPAPPTHGLFEALDADLDRLAFVLDALRAGRTNVPVPWTDVAATGMPEPPAAAVPISLALPPPELATPGQAAPAIPIVVPLPSRPAAPPAAVAALREGDELAEAESGQRALLRVRADMVDRLVNEAGEVSITRARIDGEMRALKANLLELTGSVIRLRAQVREIEIQGESQIQSRASQFAHPPGAAEGYDPLELDRYTRFQELTRSLAEGINDVATVQQLLLKNIDDADAALLVQARLSREMQQQLFSMRTVPFASLTERLYRILRQTAKELDKRANLEIRGGQVELDRSVLEKLAGPLEHLLRNALDHGIEARQVRSEAGKSETGEIALTVRQIGNEIAIEIADDGAGLDLAQIRAKAVAQERFATDASPTDAQLIECIFHPGFSTATRVTALSGRGIGMDVVRSEIAALGGRVEVTTTAGRGTTFLLYLPLTLAVAQAVLVRAAGRLWALPGPMVEQVQQIKSEALLNLYVARAVEWQGRSYPFHYLPRLLGDAQHNPETSRHNAVLLLRTGQNTVAVHVDEMIGNQEVVVKNIGPQLARVSGIAGATVLGNGEIVLIINPVQLAHSLPVPVFDPDAPDRLAAGRESAAAHRAVPVAPLVMIVDDSLTVRKMTSRLLQREGFRVITAKDGADALQMLEDEMPDIILLDIEMPRMDGFEFTKMIRGDARRSHIPIIMITSRTAEKHRNRAKELGVDLYIGKPFQEEELLRNLREMLALTS